jgi:dihydroorotate dehydrogenase (fumarate)
MDLTTTYLGMTLRTPLVPSASPLSEEIDNIKLMEDNGAAAVVLHSLFEEQLRMESEALDFHLTHGTESFAEALTYFPQLQEFRLGPDEYLDHIRKAKAAVDIPIIASLNGASIGGWVNYAQEMEKAGADALELNIYFIPSDMDQAGEDIEQNYLTIVKAVKAAVTIPAAVKLSPFFSNMANMAKRLDEVGVDGLVLFNRFYQPDIDLAELTVKPNVLLSTPQAMRLPLRWIAILYGRIQADLAATSGVHDAEDVIKMLMVGANITMMASALMRHGIEHLKVVEKGMLEWMETYEYESVRQMQGSMSQKNVANPSAFERAQYIRALQNYDPRRARETPLGLP